MLVVGLTGGIASGKSTVSRLLTDEHAISVIDLDVLARQVVERGTTTLKSLVNAFGPEILQADGTLDRPALGRIAFNDEHKRRLLNSITHSAIRRRMIAKLLWYWATGKRVVVVDTPLLVEAGLWAWCGEMVLVYWYILSSSEDQLSRMLKRDHAAGLTEDDAKSRLASQLPLDGKIPYADVVLDNTSSPEDDQHPLPTSRALQEQVGRLVGRWSSETGRGVGAARWLLEWVCPPFGIIMGMLSVVLRRRRVANRRSKVSATKSKL